MAGVYHKTKRRSKDMQESFPVKKVMPRNVVAGHRNYAHQAEKPWTIGRPANMSVSFFSNEEARSSGFAPFP
jgi:hypothetical protein